MTISRDWLDSATESYEEFLYEQLQDSERAIGYLNAALADPDPRVLSLALQDVVNARSLSAPLVGEDRASTTSLLEQLGADLRVGASSELTRGKGINLDPS
jgi:hypothetical protein